MYDRTRDPPALFGVVGIDILPSKDGFDALADWAATEASMRADTRVCAKATLTAGQIETLRYTLAGAYSVCDAANIPGTIPDGDGGSGSTGSTGSVVAAVAAVAVLLAAGAGWVFVQKRKALAGDGGGGGAGSGGGAGGGAGGGKQRPTNPDAPPYLTANGVPVANTEWNPINNGNGGIQMAVPVAPPTASAPPAQGQVAYL